MPRSTPLPDWTDEDVYCIGGGSSLRTFDFTQLAPLCTIGCNQAFLLGETLCNVCTWGDWRFWTTFAPQLGRYAGWVATNYRVPAPPPWVHIFKRLDVGMGAPGSGLLGWNGNTGALAINLALTLGAKRVYLLGYDMHTGHVPTASHWHDRAIEVPSKEHYARFTFGMDAVVADLAAVFPGRTVYNVTDGSSQLHCFPRVGFAEAGLRAP